MSRQMRRLSPAVSMVILSLSALILFGAFNVARVRAEFGTNWTAQYWDNPDFSGDPEATVTGINGINFNWGDDSPDDDVDNDTFSARFSSSQVFSQGTYEFVVSSDDGVRVYIDGVIVLDRFVARPLTTDRFTQTLSAGTHSLLVEYFENEDEASIQFQWFLVSGGATTLTPGATVAGGGSIFTPVPVGTVLPAGTTVPTGPTATVTFVQALALRTGPYTGATYITRLVRDVSYSVNARSTAEGIYPWYRITTSDGRTGWASGRYLNLSVDANSLPVAGSVFDEINGAPDTGVTYAPPVIMNLRAGPSERTPIIAKIGIGELVSVIGRTVQGGTDRWYHVRKADGTVGWVSSGWGRPVGDVRNAVPIR